MRPPNVPSYVLRRPARLTDSRQIGKDVQVLCVRCVVSSRNLPTCQEIEVTPLNRKPGQPDDTGVDAVLATLAALSEAERDIQLKPFSLSPGDWVKGVREMPAGERVALRASLERAMHDPGSSGSRSAATDSETVTAFSGGSFYESYSWRGSAEGGRYSAIVDMILRLAGGPEELAQIMRTARGKDLNGWIGGAAIEEIATELSHYFGPTDMQMVMSRVIRSRGMHPR